MKFQKLIKSKWEEVEQNGNHEVIMDLVECGMIQKEQAHLYDVPDGSGDYRVVYEEGE